MAEEYEKQTSPSGRSSSESSRSAASQQSDLQQIYTNKELERIATVRSIASARAVQQSFEPTNDDVEAQYKDRRHLPTPYEETKQDPNLVDWDGPDDPENPQNWSKKLKWGITVISALQCFVVSFGSSVFSTAVGVTGAEFGVSQEVMILGVALYVVGFACGPLVFGPLSEAYGRQRPILIGFFIFLIFQIPLAVATNLQTIFLSRFFAGAFGCAPLAIDPGLFVDIWDPAGRGVAVALYSMAIFSGPAAGPIIGEFTVKNSSLGWRWTAWFTMIMGAVVFLASLPLLKETMAPLLLQRKAAKLRVETQNWALHSKLDEQPVELSKLAAKYGLKPFKMFFAEPILIIMTIFISVVYAVLYLTFAAFPIAFEEIRHWKTGVAALPFLGIMLGSLAANAIIMVDSKTRFAKTVVRNNGIVIPEQRLPVMIFGSVILTGSLFWFAWTTKTSISWVSQVISTFFIGLGIILVFLPGLIYLTDCYLFEANSALAANSLARSLLAAGFTMFALPMFKNLGLEWSMSLLGFICLALTPFPVVFFFYGKKIRTWSKYAYVLN